MSTEPNWLNVPPAEQRDWLASPVTQRFLSHVQQESARSLEAVNDFTESDERHSAAVMSGAVKALRWVETAMTSVTPEPIPDEPEADEFVDPGALPRRKDP